MEFQLENLSLLIVKFSDYSQFVEYSYIGEDSWRKVVKRIDGDVCKIWGIPGMICHQCFSKECPQCRIVSTQWLKAYLSYCKFVDIQDKVAIFESPIANVFENNPEYWDITSKVFKQDSYKF